MQLQQLLYLKTVAETKSIRKASQKLFVSQQAISQALQKFEEEYGVQLLNRSVHGISLTEAGSYAVTVAEKILQLSDELEEYFSEQTGRNQNGVLTIVAIDTVKDFFLPEVQLKFIKTFPNISLEIYSLDAEDIVNTVRYTDKEIIGFIGIPIINGKPLYEIPPEVCFTEIARFHYGVSVGKSSPLNAYKTLSINSVLRYPICFLQDQIHDGLEKYPPYLVLAQFGKVNAIMLDSYKLYEEYIAENLGVGILVDHDFEKMSNSKTVTKLLRDDIYSSLGYIIRKENMNASLIKNFLKISERMFK